MWHSAIAFSLLNFQSRLVINTKCRNMGEGRKLSVIATLNENNDAYLTQNP